MLFALGFTSHGLELHLSSPKERIISGIFGGVIVVVSGKRSDSCYPDFVHWQVFVFGSFTENETRSLLEKKPIRAPQNHKDKSVGSLQFGSLALAAESANGELKKGQADGSVKPRPSSSHKEDKSIQSAKSQKTRDASSRADKIKNNVAKLPSKHSSGVPELVKENGITKEVSERNSLNNGVAVKADPIGLDKLCVSDGESDSLYKASNSKFQALDSESLSSDSSSGSIPRKNKQMVPPTESLPPIKDFTPRGLINAGNLCFLNATLQALLSCSPFVQLLQGIQLQDIPKVSPLHYSLYALILFSIFVCLIVIVHVLCSQAESPTLAAFSEFISELDAPSSSSFRNNVAVVESGRPFTPAMFEGVLRNFTPDVLNNMSGRPRFVTFRNFDVLCVLNS